MHFTECKSLHWFQRYDILSFCSKLQHFVVCHTLGFPTVYVEMGNAAAWARNPRGFWWLSRAVSPLTVWTLNKWLFWCEPGDLVKFPEMLWMSPWPVSISWVVFVAGKCDAMGPCRSETGILGIMAVSTSYSMEEPPKIAKHPKNSKNYFLLRTILHLVWALYMKYWRSYSD